MIVHKPMTRINSAGPFAACVDTATVKLMDDLGYDVAIDDDYNGDWVHIEPVPGAAIARMLLFLNRTWHAFSEEWLRGYALRNLRANALTDEGHAALALWATTKLPGLRDTTVVLMLVELLRRSPISFEVTPDGR